MNVSLRIAFIFLLIGLISSCKNRNEREKEDSIIESSEISSLESGEESELREIFYSIYLPTEMSRIFEKSGANYNPSIINSPDNFSKYQEPNSIAINIGIYGVDMSYARLFNQSSTTAKYLSTIKIMAEKLGIPDNHFDDLMARLEENQENRDSLISITTRMYERTDEYLKENQGESYAALIVMGGWIEAVYIATEIFESNPENLGIMDRIAEQKYSLNSLISLLSNYQDDLNVAEYLLLLKRLRKEFDKYNIYYDEEEFDVDTINRVIKTSEYRSEANPEIVREIAGLMEGIRGRFVD